MTVSQVSREYAAYDDKRKLAAAYDLFLVDSVVGKIVAQKFGKEFHVRRK